MQNTPTPQQNPENLNPNAEAFLPVLPQELSTKISAEEWGGLNEAQKRQMLLENGLSQYLEQEVSGEVPQPPVMKSEQAPEMSGEVDMSGINERKDAMAEATQEVERVEQEAQVLSQEEKARIEAEKGQNLNADSGQKVKFFGYQPSPAVVNDNDDISENGSVTDGSTWMATLLKKIFAVFS